VVGREWEGGTGEKDEGGERKKKRVERQRIAGSQAFGV
jgi:hypothetical protein